jgi:hypothetical protein
MSHRFGAGNAQYRLPIAEPRWVDTVPYFCCRRELFDRVGLFNEGLARGQDMEFSLRLRRQGCRTRLVPTAKSYYYARTDIRSCWGYNWLNGAWAVLPFAYSRDVPVRLRHLVPLGFVTSVLTTAALGVRSAWARRVCASILAAYGVASGLSALDVARRERDLRYLPVMPGVFLLLHTAYGLGSLCGVARLLREPRFWERLRHAAPREPDQAPSAPAPSRPPACAAQAAGTPR